MSPQKCRSKRGGLATGFYRIARRSKLCGAYAKLGYWFNLGLGFVISDRHDPGCLWATIAISYGRGRIFARIFESCADRDCIGCVVQIRYGRRLRIAVRNGTLEMRNPMLPSVVLFYSTVALVLAVVMILLHQSSILGAAARALSNACENLALIAIAFGTWVQRR